MRPDNVGSTKITYYKQDDEIILHIIMIKNSKSSCELAIMSERNYEIKYNHYCHETASAFDHVHSELMIDRWAE